jgi:GYF domain 2
MLLYISRLFVEFGPFEANEIQSFIQRGLLSETDYLRSQGQEDWIHISDWTPSSAYQPVSKPPAKKAAPPIAATKAAAKKAPAKKAAVKKAAAKKAKVL